MNAFTGSLLRELVNTPIRVTEILPGMVETEFSIVRFRGDKDAAKKVYQGLEPCKFSIRFLVELEKIHVASLVTAADIAEEIVWAASRPAHVNIAEMLVFPVNQASATINYRL